MIQGKRSAGESAQGKRSSVASAESARLVTLTIDGTEIRVPDGTLVIRAAELVGVQIPRFCDHPLLEPVGACRQCLVELELPGREPGSAPVPQAKPFASCTTTVMEGMVVRTQHTSAAADKAQQGVMELLLINHPLDCPVCDKGGECPLQNQALSNGRPESRFTDVKRTFPKPIPISAQVLLDRERCVLCARCTRFSSQIAGDPFIELQERGALQQVGIYANEPFESYFSGNTVQICPVGALTGASYRFRARPFDLVSSPGVCEHCASGCAQRTDHRRGKVLRRLAGDDPEVNEEWNCDKGRWAFNYTTERDRITTPLLRNEAGDLVPVSWPQALAAAAQGLVAAQGSVGVLTGGRVTVEDAYAYAKFARIALNTNNIDFRARAHSAEEARFLSTHVVGSGLTVSYRDLEQASVVLLAGLEPEEESPIVFLRLRKAVRNHALQVYSIAPFMGAGLTKLSGALLMTPPGDESATLAADSTAELLRQPGAIILAGERLAETPGALTAAVQLAERTGAGLAWVPRRAGERGALEAGALPGLLPGGRPVSVELARAELAAHWHVAAVPASPGRDTTGILAGDLRALVIGGVDLDDLPDPAAARTAVEAADFVVSLEQRHSSVTALASVVFPIAPVPYKSGTFLNWEGRARDFGTALPDTHALPDQRVLDILAAEMGVALGLPDAASARAELAGLGHWSGAFGPDGGDSAAQPAPAAPAPGEAKLASWRMLLDAGTLQDGEPNLAATARRPVVRLSAHAAAGIGAGQGDLVTVSSSRGSLTLPLAITDMAPGTVWVPRNSAGSAVYRDLGAVTGSAVGITLAAGKAGA